MSSRTVLRCARLLLRSGGTPEWLATFHNMPRRIPSELTRQPSYPLRERDTVQAGAPVARTVHGAAMPTTKLDVQPHTQWPPVPDMFDVITYFLDRGESYTLIASIGFSTKDNPKKALSARALKLWYEVELARRSAAEGRTR
jgi:hypothetical protein